MAEYMKDTFLTTKRMGMGVSSIQMEIYILENLDKIKNMERGLSIGSVFALLLVQKIRSIISNSTMVYGGVGYQMERDNTKSLMVSCI